MSNVVTRFAPSPTGMLHIGGVRTALFNYIYAKQNGGKFILRIEDTDKERSKPEYEQDIVAGMDWLGFDYGATFVRQSEREEIYLGYLKKMVDAGFAYVSKEKNTVDEDGKPLRDEVIRFKNPNKKVTFQDMIRGEVTFDTTDLGDFVIAKSMTEPLYHLAVVVDDHEMGVTHIIRGEEHLSNTPRQILIQEAIGAERPIYAHLPLILDESRAKLSKRKHGEKVWLEYYIRHGYLKDAIVNYLAMLGWNPGGEQEIFSLDELTKLFDISRVQKGGAVFNEEKLRWVNKEHMMRLPKEKLYARIQEGLGRDVPGAELEKLAPILTERVQTFGELKESIASGTFDYAFSDPTFPKEMLLWKGAGDLATTAKRLSHVASLLAKLPEAPFDAEAVKQAIWEYANAEGRGDVLWPTRIALTGKEKSPDPFAVAALVGKETAVRRLKAAAKLAMS